MADVADVAPAVAVFHVDTRSPMQDLRPAMRVWRGGRSHGEMQQQYAQANKTPPSKRPYWCITPLLTAWHARRLGWRYQYATVQAPADRHPSWVKIRHVLQHWDSLPEVTLVLDTDAWIRDGDGMQHLVSRLLAPGGPLYLAAGEPEGTEVTKAGADAMNGGFMCFRKDERVREWLQAIWDAPDAAQDCARFRTGWPWEQACMTRAYRANVAGCAGWLEVLPVPLCNTPAGTHVSHSWYKDIAWELALDDLLGGLGRELLGADETSVELVVARYQEDVSWVTPWLPYVSRVTVYDKGDTPLQAWHPRVRVVRVPNEGREAETYLRHIVEGYDDLCGTVVFTQGRYEDHMTTAEFEDLVRGRERKGVKLDVAWSTTLMRHFGWTVEKNWARGCPMQPMGMTLGKFFLTYVEDDLVPEAAVEWWPGAIFSATASQIRRRPREVYERVRATLTGSSNPETAHAMERCWKALVTGPALATGPAAGGHAA